MEGGTAKLYLLELDRTVILSNGWQRSRLHSPEFLGDRVFDLLRRSDGDRDPTGARLEFVDLALNCPLVELIRDDQLDRDLIQ